VIVADTSAIIALLDRDDRHHSRLAGAFRETRREWVLPWATLAEIDYAVGRGLGRNAARAFLKDVAEGQYEVEWGERSDMERALALDSKYSDLGLGMVDAVVMATAERLDARAIVTLDLRDFAAVELVGRPALWPRDLTATP
jgi:predicted nucleic acid-binding protein